MKRTLNLLTLIAFLFAASAAQATVPGFGVYRYDGAGNIVEAAGESYAYDTFGRLRTATAGGHQQEFVYDRYGNIRGITTDGNAALAIRPGVNPANNWANLTHDPDTGLPNNMVTRHDLAGNVEIAPGGSFEYDALNTVTVSTVDGVRRLHLYSASDERIATLTATASGHRSDWTVRDPAGRVLRRFASDGAGAWQWTEDYIYAGSGQLLAAEVPSPEKIRHFHLDHLGTPRLTTGNGGAELARHTYYPFGGELPDAVQDGEHRKFTGHERDSASVDYLHARYYQPVMGRFLSADPGRDWNPSQPQSFNLFSYVRNNPVNATDPTGLWTFSFGISFGGSTIGWNASTKYAIAVDDDGNIALVRSRAAGGGAIATYGQGSAEIAGEWSPAHDTVHDMAGRNLVIGASGGILGSGSIDVAFGDRGAESVSVSFGLGAGGEGHGVLEGTSVLWSANMPDAMTGPASLLSQALHLAMESATTPPPPQAVPERELEEERHNIWAFHP